MWNYERVFPDVPALFDSSTWSGSAWSAIHRIPTQISCEIRLAPVGAIVDG
jgi:hypothetical protein